MIDVDQLAIELDGGVDQHARCAQRDRHGSGGRQQVTIGPELVLQVREHPSARPQVSEHLAQAGDRLLGAVKRAVLPLRIIKAVLPAAVRAGGETERILAVTQPPRPLWAVQPPPPANARAAGTTNRSCSGESA